VAKYVCIDPESSDVFSPVSEVLNENSFDPRFMFEATNTKDREMLQTTQEKGKRKHTIEVTTRVTSKCNSREDAVEMVPCDQVESNSSTKEAASFKYEGLKWENYTGSPTGYEPDGSHITIDGVVYTESTTKLPSDGLAVCVQQETGATLVDKSNALGRFSCVESTGCQKFIETHACGWGEKTGVLYKRVGRVDGKCLDKEKLRKVLKYGFFGEEEYKCPDDKYHSTSSTTGWLRGKGFLFCQCSGDCD
jgi:hypothetical protein